jgi:hypothetical protein
MYCGPRRLELICDWQAGPAHSAEEQELFRGFDFQVQWNVPLAQCKRQVPASYNCAVGETPYKRDLSTPNRLGRLQPPLRTGHLISN